MTDLHAFSDEKLNDALTTILRARVEAPSGGAAGTDRRTLAKRLWQSEKASITITMALGFALIVGVTAVSQRYAASRQAGQPSRTIVRDVAAPIRTEPTVTIPTSGSAARLSVPVDDAHGSDIRTGKVEQPAMELTPVVRHAAVTSRTIASLPNRGSMTRLNNDPRRPAERDIDTSVARPGSGPEASEATAAEPTKLASSINARGPVTSPVRPDEPPQSGESASTISRERRDSIDAIRALRRQW